LTPESSLRLSAVKKLKSSKEFATVAKVGNSFSFRVRKEVIDAFSLKNGQKLKLEVEGRNKIIINS